MSVPPPLRCCISCGRDTRNKSQVCRVCMKGIGRHTTPVEPEEVDEPSQVERDILQALLEATECQA